MPFALWRLSSADTLLFSFIAVLLVFASGFLVGSQSLPPPSPRPENSAKVDPKPQAYLFPKIVKTVTIRDDR